MGDKRKRAHITQAGHSLIMMRALEYPRLKREPLAEQLQNDLEGLGYDIPEVEVLKRYISDYRNRAEDHPQDKPFRMSTLEEYPIPSSSLTNVLKVYKFRAEKGASFTIREAKWVSRLFALFYLDSQIDNSGINVDKLYKFARLYAGYEQCSVVINKPLDYTVLDHFVLGLPLEKDDDAFIGIMMIFAGMGISIKQLSENVKRLKKGLPMKLPENLELDI